MSDQNTVEPVAEVASAVVAEKAVKVKKEKVVKEPKPKAEPKPMRFRAGSGWDAEKWARHMADISAPSIPEGYIGMAKVCDAANSVGIKTTRLVTAAGGDRASEPVWHPVFQVTYVGGRKYMRPEVLTEGFALLKNPEFHAVVKKIAKPKAEGEGEAKVGKKVKIKTPAGEAQPWIAKPE